jgi:alkylhydroperoxidase family enzyme
MLAHGAVLHKNGFSVEQIIAILKDFHQAGLAQAEVDMMDLAYKMSTNDHSVTQADIQRLHQDGFLDEEITDIALAASVRNFLARFFDALGAGPDPQLIAQEPDLWRVIQGL